MKLFTSYHNQLWDQIISSVTQLIQKEILLTASKMEYSDISLSQLGVIRIKISFTLTEQEEN